MEREEAYYHWRWEHAIHHGTAGHLDKRGTGDVWTMTVQKYLESSRWRQFAYQLARNPLVLFVLAPLFVFVIRQRFASSNVNRRERWMILSAASDCKFSGADMHGDTTARIEARLRELDLVLPDPPRPAGGYMPVLVRNHIGVVSGQFPFASGELPIRGRIGADVSETDGRRAAQLAALNVLAQIRAALGGFYAFTGLLRMDGWVACAPGFMSQPSILDGASQCLRSVLGEQLGAHTRTLLSLDRLPFDAPVELAVMFTTRPTANPEVLTASGLG